MKNTKNMKSKIDELFYNLYGYVPNKKGKAYELLVGASLKLINNSLNVSHDKYLTGLYSDDKYQLDLLLIDKLKTFVEAKDYSHKMTKVGRGDISKLSGSLLNLDIDKGIVASATGYTKPARKYAKSTVLNSKATQIELYNIRPSTKEDEEGRITEVNINLTVIMPMFQKSKWEPIIHENGFKRLKEIYGQKQIEIRDKLENVYHMDGTVMISMYQLSGSVNEASNGEDVYSGTWKPSTDAFIPINGQMIQITGINYELPYSRYNHLIKIEQKGTACLYISDESGKIDKVLTDLDLKRAVFNSDGTIDLKP